MEPLRIGVLGAARISFEAICTPAAMTGHRLVAVAARDHDRAVAFAEKHSVERVLDSYQAVIDDPEVEAIYNPLANGLHAPWNLAAIAAGKHVLTEKPSASNAEEAREVRAAAAAAGVQVMEAFHYPYHPVTRRLMEVLASGEIGELRHVDVQMHIPPPPAGDLRWSFPLAGGAMMDLGCYGVHMHRTIGALAGGEPTVVAARGGAPEGNPGIDAWLDVDLAFPGGATGLARCSMTADTVTMSTTLIGTKGEACAPSFVQPDVDDRVIVTVDGQERTEHTGTRPSYAYQLEAFAALVREGTPVATGVDDAVATAELIDACYLAAGFPVRPRSAL